MELMKMKNHMYRLSMNFFFRNIYSTMKMHGSLLAMMMQEYWRKMPLCSRWLVLMIQY